ncbi:hypothetical protein JK203_15395 [Gluconobacter cerinus]|uniref:hypothetical protein n=1 Tax=Gluconobacter cerinus TaxID=38307 RepID=UPI001B8ACF68|nr:hypothetical protein [Gluconobacter cerinus]MBS1042204.1 hypothetical protein [Gluconobacter cerinus]MBS1048751.1 hypothetical protein [Gluconobacter cerinus]
MNPVEIEEAVSLVAETPLNLEEFPFEFLQAFENHTPIAPTKGSSIPPRRHA